MSSTQHEIEQTFAAYGGRVLATLINDFGDFDLAEDVMQEAFVVALEHWTANGVPPNPGGWIMVTARRKAIDHLRRAKVLDRKLADLYQEPEELDIEGIPDERLKLIFTCCHPALAQEAQVALTLRTLAGLSTEDIARAFLVPVSTMAQRLVRAKRKIATAGIPYRVPPLDVINERLDAVLSVIYLIFNEGYAASSGDDWIRHDLCVEAIRLGTVLTELMPQSPEALGLLALMLLHHSRHDARVDDQGGLVVLEEQDRSRWDQAMIAEGLAALERASHMKQPGVYQLQAAISAVHAGAARFEDTDWEMIATLYRELYHRQPSPIINLNWAVAIAMAAGYEYGLWLIDKLGSQTDLSDYVPYHAARADLLRRLGQSEKARDAYQRAVDLSQNTAERAFFQKRLNGLTESPHNDR